MPMIYLSPSTQEKNYYVNGGTEEQYMNLLADKMVPYLNASGIRYSRNTPEMTAVSSIAASNAGNYDLHLALHSNAAPERQYGQARGILVFYYPGSVQGQVVVASVRGTDGRGGGHVGGIAGVSDTGCGEIGLHGVGQAVHPLLFGAPVDIQVVLLGGGGEIDDGHRDTSFLLHPMHGDAVGSLRR